MIMKNLLLTGITCMLISISLQAQQHSPNRLLQKGQTDLSIGYGMLAISKVMDQATTNLPPLSLRADRQFSNNFSLGWAYTIASHTSQPSIVEDGFQQSISNTIHQVVLRPAFHMTRIRNADLYGGFQIGINLEYFRNNGGNPAHLEQHHDFQPNRIKGVYSAFLGGRYFLCDRWNVFGEVGFSTALATVGIGYRI